LRSRVLQRMGAMLALAVSLELAPASSFARGAARIGAGLQASTGIWEPAIRRFEDQDRVAPPPQNGIVFVGSSSIVRWNLPESFPDLGPSVINRGFGGSELKDSVEYAHRIVIPYKPRVVVLYAGDNDIEAGATPEQIARQFVAFERKVHAALPQAKIVFVSIKPSIRRWKWMDAIRATNARIEEYCANHRNLVYLDVVPKMLTPGGEPRKELLVEDGLHMTPAGYRIWNEALGPLLK
jgi:lysophospholipase L1-like esterase